MAETFRLRIYNEIAQIQRFSQKKMVDVRVRMYADNQLIINLLAGKAARMV